LSLRIAFDLDGVLADMESELIRHAELLFGEAMTRHLQERAAEQPDDTAAEGAGEGGRAGAPAPENVRSSPDSLMDNAPPIVRLNMTSRQRRKLWKHVEAIENFWETLNEIEPGTIRRLAAASQERRWEVIFLTKRPQSVGLTSQLQTQRWLQSKGFPVPSVFVVQGSRGRIASALDLDVVVDDRPENCLDVVVDSKARAILIWREDRPVPRAAQRLGIGTVKSTSECLDILLEVEEKPADRASMMDRVKQLLGLTTSA
jgi:hypothetical protein